ncbi:hypothetical protein ACOSQ2_018561 [Xanthoceras sorbifolium]
MPPPVQQGYPYDNYQYHQSPSLYPPPASQLFPPSDNPQIQNLETQVQALTQNLARIVNMMGVRRGDDADEEQSRISARMSSSDWSEGEIGLTNFDHPLQRQGQRNEGITRSREERDDYIPDPEDGRRVKHRGMNAPRLALEEN